MPDNLSLILNKYNLISLFTIENDEFQSVNSDDALFTEKQMKQSMVVLKQTLSALQDISFVKMVINGKSRISVFIKDANRIIGYVSEEEIDDQQLVNALKAPIAEETKTEKAPAVEKKKEEPVAERKEEKIEERDYDARILKNIDNVAEEYLEDFAYDIIENIKSDVGLTDSDKYSSKLLLKYIEGIEQSASMLIGPTRAEEMRDKMKNFLNKLEDV